METFFITHEEFWQWFEREDTQEFSESSGRSFGAKSKDLSLSTNDNFGHDGWSNNAHGNKRLKTDMRPPSSGERYDILYGPHKPGKKTKIWAGDGYLTLVGQMAHLCDLRGRMLEDPVILDEIDYEAVKGLGELVVGNTEVQVIELNTQNRSHM